MMRQGDVMLVRVGRLPKGAKPRAAEGGRHILAHGEATGHAHAIAEAEAEMFTTEDGVYLRSIGVSTLRHEEHAPITIDKGVYRVVRQREYSPEAIRNVAD